MNKYAVKVTPRAGRDLEEIYRYILDNFKAEGTAQNMADALEEAILSLDVMPYRGPERRIGVYANKGYRQIFVKNFTIVYRIDEKQKTVIVLTVRYTPSNF